MEGLRALDENLLLAINGAHAEWLDLVMLCLSSKVFWIPSYVLLAGLLYWRMGWARFLVAIGVLVPVILISDQLASGVLKEWVARPRPCHEEELQVLLHLVREKCGGPYGFASSHAANFFALASYLSGLFGARDRDGRGAERSRSEGPGRNPRTAWTPQGAGGGLRGIAPLPYVLFGVAALVSYSRVYMGVHYPSDVVAGAVIGVMAGVVGIFLFKFLSKRLNFPQTTDNKLD
jgi:undecaprenyl-diphosphatase